MVAVETKEKSERIKVIDSLVRTCLEKKEAVGLIIDAVRLGASEKVINSVVDACIKSGAVETAQEVAVLIGRSFSQEEIDFMVKHNIEKRVLWDAFKAAELGASKEVTDLIVKAFIDEGRFEFAKRAAKLAGRKLTLEEINALARICIKKGWVQEALKLVKKAGASKDLIEPIITSSIKQGLDAYALKAAKLAGRKLTTKEIDSLVEHYITPELIKDARKVAKKLARRDITIKEIDTGVRRYIDKKDFHGGLDLAKLGASREAIDSLVRLCIKKEEFYYALETAKLGASDEAIMELVKAAKGIHYIGEAIKLIIPNKAKEALKEALVESYIGGGLVGGAQKSAERAGRELTTEEIERLREVILTK